MVYFSWDKKDKNPMTLFSSGLLPFYDQEIPFTWHEKTLYTRQLTPRMHLYFSTHQTLEKEMATHSSILLWEIPGTEKLGRLQSMGSQGSKTQLSD